MSNIKNLKYSIIVTLFFCCSLNNSKKNVNFLNKKSLISGLLLSLTGSNSERLVWSDSDYNLDLYSYSTQLVNTDNIFGDQTNPDVAALTDGGLVVCYESNSNIFYKRFDNNISPINNDTQVNDDTNNIEGDCSITSILDGGFAITWEDAYSSGRSVYLKIYDKNENVSPQIHVTSTTQTYRRSGPKITELEGNRIAITWEYFYNAYFKKYFINGTADGSSIQITVPNIARFSSPHITKLIDNKIGIALRSLEIFTGDEDNIYGKIYTYDGIPFGQLMQPTIYSSRSNYQLDIKGFPNGNIIIAWGSIGSSTYTTLANIYNSSGYYISGFEIPYNSGSRRNPSISILSNNNFFLSWESVDYDTSYCQFYNSHGMEINNDFVIGGSEQKITIYKNNLFAVSEGDSGEDNSGMGIYLNRYQIANSTNLTILNFVEKELALEYGGKIHLFIRKNNLPVVSYITYQDNLMINFCEDYYCHLYKSLMIEKSSLYNDIYTASTYINHLNKLTVVYSDSSNLTFLTCDDFSCNNTKYKNLIDNVNTYDMTDLYFSEGRYTASYYDSDNDVLKTFTCNQNNCKNITVDPIRYSGRGSSMDIYNNSKIIIYFTNEGAKLVKCNNLDCNDKKMFTNLDFLENFWIYNSLKINKNGIPLIIYYDSLNQDLKLLICGNLLCNSNNNITTLDSSGNLGTFLWLRITKKNIPIILYTDLTNYYDSYFRLMKCGDEYCGRNNSIYKINIGVNYFDDISFQLDKNDNPIFSYGHSNRVYLYILDNLTTTISVSDFSTTNTKTTPKKSMSSTNYKMYSKYFTTNNSNQDTKITNKSWAKQEFFLSSILLLLSLVYTLS